MSMNTAPREPALVFLRIQLGFVSWQLLSAAAREALKAQVVLEARNEMARLVLFARREHAFSWVRDALAGEPALRSAFELGYLRRLRY
jgi:hypothetical protein